MSDLIIDQPGFYRLTPEQYFADPCPEPSLSQSGIKTLTKTTAARFAQEHPRLGGVKEAASKANRLRGDICHRLTLGRGKDYRVGDFADWRTKASQEFKVECAQDSVTPVLAKDMASFERMAATTQAEKDKAWRLASKVREDLDRSDPDRLVELEVLYEQPLKEVAA